MASILECVAIMENKILLCIFAIIILFSGGCTKEPKAKKPLDYSRVKAVINGRECHMISGYNCEPENRTLVGQEFKHSVCLSFHSLYMAEYPDHNDSVFRISILLCLNKDDVAYNKGYSFNRSADSTDYWISHFNNGTIKTPIIFASIELNDYNQHSSLQYYRYYYSKEGYVSFNRVDIKEHLLYGGERWAWMCKEVFFEFDAESADGRVISVRDGYCCL